MSSWAGRRKLFIGGVTAIIILGAVGFSAYKFFYVAPTCFDGFKNGDETGLDCGGSCERLCPSEFLAPRVSWTTFEQLAPGLYNIAAYVVNPNAEGEAYGVPFNVILYDKEGVQIAQTTGSVHIPPNRNTLAFVGPLNVGKRIPYRAFFEFSASPDWIKSVDRLKTIAPGEKNYTEDANTSSLLVTLKNISVTPLGKMSVYAILSDVNSNIIGFSKTIVDGIDGKSTALAPFTWPKSHDGKVISIEVLPVAE
jgi:hypothetical protein